LALIVRLDCAVPLPVKPVALLPVNVEFCRSAVATALPRSSSSMPEPFVEFWIVVPCTLSWVSVPLLLKMETPRSNEPLISVLSIRVSVALPMAPPARPVLLERSSQSLMVRQDGLGA
jgi:hypothetical protein